MGLEERTYNSSGIRANLEGSPRLITAFEIAHRISNSSNVFLYGGQVRQLIIGAGTSRDYDFIGDFNLEKIANTFDGKVNGIWPEVSNLRLNFRGLVFDITAASDVKGHLAECDITLSTMYMSWDGRIHGPFGALSDIKSGY